MKISRQRDIFLGGCWKPHPFLLKIGACFSQNGPFMKILIAFFVLLLTVLFAGPLDRYGRRRFGFSLRTVSGLEFVLLGILFSQVGLNIFTEKVILQLFPIISFSLGWLGFLVTIDFDIRILRKVGIRSILFAVILAFLIFISVSGGFYLLNRWYPIFTHLEMPWLLGVLAVATSPLLLRHMAQKFRVRPAQMETLLFLTAFGGVLGIFVYGAMADFLKITPWWRNLLLDASLGLGSGLLLNVLVSGRRTHNEMLLFVYGTIFLSSGLAGLLGLSPLFVNAIAGAVVANSSVRRYRIAAILSEAEQLILVLILVTFGALWSISPGEWKSLAVPIVGIGVGFFLLRLLGRWLGAKMIGALFKTDVTSLSGALLCQVSILVALLIDFRLFFPSLIELHKLFVGLTLAMFLSVWPAYRLMDRYLKELTSRTPKAERAQ